ncbi:hypothetical protein [Paenibacillus sp. J22TS3]|uniref:hypothetical protein n=1 Tax=Paenibacillus sp. J22TS3 TaxID=2807192 RepID=UPI001AFD488E|nr:hypothetical protein [Paenibacillus sp. J22TS3]GIP19917.1 hypothetical protein J22TS3_01920 [Paenibacillus sp. J22TS3]
MKITDLAVVFILIVSPFFWINSVHSHNRLEAQQLSMRYTSALRTAAQDGGSRLNENALQEYEPGYASTKFFRANKEKALDSLLCTLYMNFGIGDDRAAQMALLTYIPAVVVIDYDGYYIYSFHSFQSSEGEELGDYRWTSKKPYAFSDQAGNIVHFTLDEHIAVYQASEKKWLKGSRDQLDEEGSIPLLRDKDLFEAKRRTVIVQAIEEDLARVMNSHNRYASRLGVDYTFTLPIIPGEEWINTLNDIGLLVFLQGIPIGDQHYNNYGLGGGRLLKRPVIYGGTHPVNGLKYYYRDTCKQEFKLEEVFTHEREAAAKGYYEPRCPSQGKTK